MITLRSLRMDAGMTCEQLAAAVSREVGETLTLQAVQSWERRGIRDVSRVLALAKIYRTTPTVITIASSNSSQYPNFPLYARAKKIAQTA